MQEQNLTSASPANNTAGIRALVKLAWEDIYLTPPERSHGNTKTAKLPLPGTEIMSGESFVSFGQTQAHVQVIVSESQ
ncbi:hypothetical protein TMEN_4600 [Trichophyton mentagrophytes]|nr:hypothetical protein TMEN_4600 [Trichophyton mentagrophytes]